MTTSSPSSAGSLAVTRPNPFAADHRTTVSLSRNATSSASMTSSTPSGMSQSSSSSSGWGVTLGVFTAATAAPPAAKLSSSEPRAALVPPRHDPRLQEQQPDPLRELARELAHERGPARAVGRGQVPRVSPRPLRHLEQRGSGAEFENRRERSRDAGD